MSRAAKVWTFAASQYSSSVNLAQNDPVGLRVPVMEAGTVGLRIQKTADGMDVADPDATWDPAMVDIYDNIIELPASESVVKTITFNPGAFLSLGRCRLQAVDAAGSGVAQVAQVVTPRLREI